MKRHSGCRNITWTVIGAFLLCLVLVSAAFADNLVVRVQPGGDTFAKAYVITGEPRTYFGNVEGGTGQYEYRWEFSNGGDTAFASVSNPRYIAVDNKVFDSAGTHWARLTVRDSGNPQQTASASINLQVIPAADDNLTRKKNSAVDRGLRYQYLQEQVSGDVSTWPGWYGIADSAMAVVAFENHGHNLLSPDSDIYKKSVQRGVQFLLNSAQIQELTQQRCIGDPEAGDGDSDHDGKGVYWNYSMYENPIAMLAIINSCDKQTAQATVVHTSNGVNGQTLWDIIVDAKDFLAWAQNDGNSFAQSLSSTSEANAFANVFVEGANVTDIQGGMYLYGSTTQSYGGVFTIQWGDGTSSTYTDTGEIMPYGYADLSYYAPGLSHNYSTPGTYTITITYSSNATTVTALVGQVVVGGAACGAADAAQGAGGWRYSPNDNSSDNSVTQWPTLALAEAKKRWDIDVNPAVKTMLDTWLKYSQNDNGGFGYTAPADWVNFPKTAAGTIMLNYVEVPSTSSRLANAFSWLDSNWNYENFGNLYSMYAFYKGMKSWNKPELNGRKWEDLYTDYLVSYQQGSGYWNTDTWEDSSFATSSALAILAPAIASLPPVANAGGPYAEVNPGQAVSLNGSKSYHQDPNLALVKWEWDFNAADGLWWDTKAAPAAGEGAVGMTPNASYPDAGKDASYTVTLRVTDNAKNPATDTDTATVKVTSGNVAPVAATNGPWSALPGQTITFDASKSYDPNAGAPLYDEIVSYEWDLDGDGIFNEANGDDGTPVIAGSYKVVSKGFPAPVSLPAVLRVTDRFGKAGTSTATANIISIAVVYGQNYETCYRTTLNRYQERQGLKVTFKNQGNAAADNLKLTLTSLPSNLTVSNNKSVSVLGTLAAGEQKTTACDATAKTADIEVIFDRRISPTGDWRWRSEFDFGGGHYIVDNIPPLAPVAK